MAIITVVSPGFLTVQPALTTNTTLLQVPQPHFNMTNFGTLQFSGGQSAISGNTRILKLAYRIALVEQPAPLNSTFRNETYHLDFHGPAIKCASANDSLVKSVTIKCGTALGASSGNPIDFISWAAGDELLRVMNKTEEAATLDMTSTDAARLFVMTSTGNWTKTLNATSNGISYSYRQVNVTECLLYNASYNVDYKFEYPAQTRELQITDWFNPVAAITQFTRPNPATELAVVSYTSIMDAIGKMLVGSIVRSHYGADTAYLTSSKILNIDWTSGEAVARSLEQLFQNITLSLLGDDSFMYVVRTSTPSSSTTLTVSLATIPRVQNSCQSM
jgi:hypothetical protein